MHHAIHHTTPHTQVGQSQPETVLEVPAGHYWTPDTGLVRYYQPAWLVQTGRAASAVTTVTASLRSEMQKFMHAFTRLSNPLALPGRLDCASSGWYSQVQSEQQTHAIVSTTVVH